MKGNSLISQTKAAIDQAEGIVEARISNAGAAATSGAIAAAKLAASVNKTTAPVYIDELLNAGAVFARRKLNEAVTRTAIKASKAKVSAQKKVSQPSPIDPFQDQDEAESNTEKYIGKIYNTEGIQGSVILGDIKDGQNPITFIDNNGAEQTLPRIPIAAAIVSCSPSKNIVKTNINGRDGSIKEYTGMNDLEITIDCTVNFQFGQGGSDTIQEIDLLYQCPYAIPVTNKRINDLGVYYIVIDRIDYQQKVGEYSNLYFSIKACSDIPIKEILP
jgi:hypothetical protein